MIKQQQEDDYEREYNQNLSRVRSFLASSSSAARSLTTLKECDRLLTHARRCANAIMDLHSVSMTGGNNFSREQWQRKIEQEIGPLRYEIDRSFLSKEGVAHHPLQGTPVSASSQNSRNSGNGYIPPSITASNSSFKLQEGSTSQSTMNEETERLIQSSEALLLESKALCAESEEIGNETLETMMRQREQLYITSDYANATRTNLVRARILLKELGWKMLRNKIFLRSIIVILIIANILVLFYIVKRKLT